MSRLSFLSFTGAILYALAPIVMQSQSQASSLPEGKGKQLVESICTACHSTDQITPSSCYTLTGWKELTSTMIDLSGNTVPEMRLPDSGPKSHPYAIAVVDGIVWYNESGKRPDALVRFDPETGTFQSWPIPSGGVYAGIIRHMRPTREGNLLIHQSSTNRIMLVTLKDYSASP